jgi:transposase
VEVVNPICCGIDVHETQLVACLRVAHGRGKAETTTREFGTTVSELLSLQQWLAEESCPIAVVESTGVYWKPVFHVLSSTVEVLVANAQHVRQRPGKKRDVADAEWLAELLAHGLVVPSFIPPPEIRALRDLTRARVGLVQSRSQTMNRVYKVLEDTNLKFQSVMSDLFGVSGRAMLDALVAGKRDPQQLAQMARGVLRRKLPQLELALQGQFTEHHAVLVKQSLELVDVLTRQIAEIDARIELAMATMAREVELLRSIPGIDHKAANTVLGEIGRDMSRFGSDKRLASWTKLSPGNNESAGKRRSGRTGRGNKYLKRVLVQCAWAARRTDTYLGRTFRRLEARIGGKKAAVAVAHKILVIIYHVLSNGEFYDESRYDHLTERQEQRTKFRALKVLEHLGYQVELTPRAAELPEVTASPEATASPGAT